MLVELNKVNAPSLLLEDYNYFINKAVNQYINKKYNLYDINQQSTDDLRVLKATAALKAKKVEDSYKNSLTEAFRNNDNTLDISFFNDGDLFGATYEVDLPDDYLHMLNCLCIYEVNKPYKCYPVGKTWTHPATRLTADAWSSVYNNAYMCPSYRRPYYYIHNVNKQSELPTDIYENGTGTDLYANWNAKDGEQYNDDGTISGSTLPRKIDLTKVSFNNNVPLTTTLTKNDIVDKTTFSRHANPTRVRCEIRYGKDSEVFELKGVLVDYLKAPLHIKLTQELIDLTLDRSQMLEFPDYICQEIINELVHLIMENASDLRIQTHNAVTTSIGQPTQQLTPQQSK